MSGHHIPSMKMLLGTASALLVLTVVTVALAGVGIPSPFNVVVALAVAVAKATLVVMFFMNLYYDDKFNTLVFLSSILFFIIMVGITMLDTMFREPILPSF